MTLERGALLQLNSQLAEGVRKGDARGWESFLDERDGNAIHAMIKCHVDLALQLVG
jgi:hypothetical protein